MSAPGDQCSGLSWVIDPWGNRKVQNAQGGSCFAPSVSVGVDNRLSGGPYQYDAAGNLTNDGVHTYTYDAEERLTKVDGGATATYVYDASGARVEKTVGSSDSQYLYDRNGQMNTVFNNGVFQRMYVYMDGAPLAEYFENTTYFVHRDHLGSTRLLSRLDRSVRESDDHYPYGELIPSTPNTGDVNKFTGKERDGESGLDNFGKRYLGSTMGRWMSPDLVNVTEDRVVNPANTLNKYIYGGNNPLKYIDPDGQDITYFYDQGGIAGHAILFAYNQATGDSAIESFGPTFKFPIAPGESMFEMSTYKSADDLRGQLTAFTIQTTPGVTQQVIDYIRTNPDPALWVAPGPNCSTQVWKILQKFKLAQKASRLDAAPQTPRNLWLTLIRTHPNPFHQGFNPRNGADYGNNQFDMFNLMWLTLPQSEPKATVTSSARNCVKVNDSQQVCDVQ
jgi:RHS repeat-associated protein